MGNLQGRLQEMFDFTAYCREGVHRAWTNSVDGRNPPPGLRDGAESLWLAVTTAFKDWMRADFASGFFPKTDQDLLEIIHTHVPCPFDTAWFSFRVPLNKVRAKDKKTRRT